MSSVTSNSILTEFGYTSHSHDLTCFLALSDSLLFWKRISESMRTISEPSHGLQSNFKFHFCVRASEVERIGLRMEDCKLKSNISCPNLVAYFLQKKYRSVESVLLSIPPNPTHITTSHTNRSMWHIKPIITPSIGQLLFPINRTRFELPCSLGTTISPSATGPSSAKSYGIKFEAR